MNQMIHNYIVFELAGIMPLLLEYGIGGLMIAACLAAAYFSPIGKKDFLYAAAVLGIVMVTFTIGVSNGEKRIQAQWDAARVISIDTANKAHADALRDVSRHNAPHRWLRVKPDPDLRDGK